MVDLMRFLIVLFHCLGEPYDCKYENKNYFYVYKCKGRRKRYTLQSNIHLPISTSDDEHVHERVLMDTPQRRPQRLQGRVWMGLVFLISSPEPRASRGQCKASVLSNISWKTCPVLCSGTSGWRLSGCCTLRPPHPPPLLPLLPVWPSSLALLVGLSGW